MESRTCTNVSCGASSLTDWKNGWPLRSGEFATLCDTCGIAYEQSSFCDVFHATNSGWRECTLCGKRLHCGCIASRSLLELLDSGGVICMNCTRNSKHSDIAENEIHNEVEASKLSGNCKLQSIYEDNQLDGSGDKMKLILIDNNNMENERSLLLQSQSFDTNKSLRQMKQEVIFPSLGDIGQVCVLEFNRDADGSCEPTIPGICKVDCRTRDLYESLMQTSIGTNWGSENSCPLIGVSINEREHSKTSSPLQGSRSFPLMPKPPRSVLAAGLDANTGTISQTRVARPPVEGRGRNQLLPRYWPRITDQELQQISGSSNSTVVPLFEKMLSASDAGRIGRLVVPKACAEAYFPPISQPEGLPIRIQDVKGKEWVFQFRFWPNNNSRMYVLEGVTPCIQSMQLQAGDTVTFSRMDPEGKLIMGFRKAPASAATQGTHLATIPCGSHSSETSFSGAFDNLSIVNGHSSLFQSLKESGDSQLIPLPKHLNPASADLSYYRTEKHDDRTKEHLLLPSGLVPAGKKARNIGSKNKRLLIDNQDSLELKLTWEEVQDLLCPPPSVKPSKVMIEDHEFEEYEDPPIFGKRSIFVARSLGGQEQWVVCDECSKWRRLPIDVLLATKWTCIDNVWDQSRRSCSAPEELTLREMENLCRLIKDFKRRRIIISQRSPQDYESSGLEALANAATLGDNESDTGTASVATTTRHPRHRPGCSCIVCIQPPSGKGKHKPSCSCNVCMTVKRRFKTLMMRKKKRQSEREAEIAQRNQHKLSLRDETELETTSRHASLSLDPSENEGSRNQNKVGETGKSQLDLNFHPEEEQLLLGSKGVSMMSLVQVASLPLEMYLKQNGLTSLISDAPTSSTSNAGPQAEAAYEIEGEGNDDSALPAAAAAAEQESGGEEHCEAEQSPNNTQ